MDAKELRMAAAFTLRELAYIYLHPVHPNTASCCISRADELDPPKPAPKAPIGVGDTVTVRAGRTHRKVIACWSAEDGWWFHIDGYSAPVLEHVLTLIESATPQEGYFVERFDGIRDVIEVAYVDIGMNDRFNTLGDCTELRRSQIRILFSGKAGE